MKVWRCKICGDSFVGTRRPSNCPFCGAREKFVLLASDWKTSEGISSSESTKEIMEQALGMELSKAAFYACAADKADGGLGFAVFDALSREHGKHALVMRRGLGLPRPSTGGQGTCHETTEANLEEACERQRNAVTFYERAWEKLSEPAVQEVFSAVAEIEVDQLTLVERLLSDLRK